MSSSSSSINELASRKAYLAAQINAVNNLPLNARGRAKAKHAAAVEYSQVEKALQKAQAEAKAKAEQQGTGAAPKKTTIGSTDSPSEAEAALTEAVPAEELSGKRRRKVSFVDLEQPSAGEDKKGGD